MKGVATTSGAPELKDHITDSDATVVTRMRKAGGVILGKTNLPVHALDMQTYNPLFGTTNNPWNLERTTGGSTGGGAAAVAAGLSYIETGSDIGGSIREPSNFCGVFGHKPTVHVVPKTGFNPPGPPSLPNVLSVCGPLARSAGDLKTAMEVLGGPDGADALAYKWTLPPARHTILKDYKVRFVIDDKICPVVPEVKEQLHAAVEALAKAGATVEEGWPEGVNAQEQIELYLQLLITSIPPQQPPPPDKIPPAGFSSVNIVPLFMKTLGMNFRGYIELQNKRIQAQTVWQEFFKSYDAFLMPTNFLAAFPHDHSEPMMLRTLETTLGKRAYLDLLYWISFATFTGLPATVAPVGRTSDYNLPVGMQILGPYLEDATPIDLAGRLADITGGFTPPPGYA
jgi:amidase